MLASMFQVGELVWWQLKAEYIGGEGGGVGTKRRDVRDDRSGYMAFLIRSNT